MESGGAARSLSGREHELALILRLLERAATGPAAFALEGDPGIGKTTIWRAGVEAALARMTLRVDVRRNRELCG